MSSLSCCMSENIFVCFCLLQVDSLGAELKMDSNFTPSPLKRGLTVFSQVLFLLRTLKETPGLFLSGHMSLSSGCSYDFLFIPDFGSVTISIIGQGQPLRGPGFYPVGVDISGGWLGG